MILPNNGLVKLGYQHITNEIHSLCKTYYGKENALQTTVSFKYNYVKFQLESLRELQDLASEGLPDILEIDSISETMRLLSKKGSQLNGDELAELGLSLEVAENWYYFFNSQDVQEYPSLKSFSQKYYISKGLSASIFRIVDHEGEILDTASPELKRLRKEIENQFRASRKIAQRLYNELNKQGFIPEASTLSVKNGRTVIPLKSEHKRRVSGYIQGESATGQTVFLEPAELIESSNQLQELKSLEKREIMRILTQLTEELHNSYDEIGNVPEFIGLIDLLHAKYKLIGIHDYIVPELQDTPEFSWYNAYHPLLKTANEQENKLVVPIDIALDNEKRILVVSGPNAGGKSVSLKTVGLLQCMIQSGIPVPVSESSKFGFFKSIFIDIGDDQSIENDLSTYSSHLDNMSKSLSNANQDSLILFDEFGSGTEPGFGGAIAQVILEELVLIKCKGVITTHYQNIKQQAEETDGLINGAMRYDTKNMKPLYQLTVGKPGQSFALEIAEKIGLNKKIIDKAADLVGTNVVTLDRLLSETEEQQSELEKRSRDMKRLENKLNQQTKTYEEKLRKLEFEKKDILKKAAEEATFMISSANREIEKTIRHIKTSKANKNETRKVRDKLSGVKEKISKKIVEKQIKEKGIKGTEIKAGDRVRLEGQNGSGIIQKVKGNNAEILFGQVTVRAKTAKLELLEKGKEEKKTKASIRSQSNLSVTTKRANFSNELNIRGMRADEAISELEKFLDEALLSGVEEIRILHGKGEGVLRNITRDILKNFKFTDSFHDDHADRGGAGITVAYLK